MAAVRQERVGQVLLMNGGVGMVVEGCGGWSGGVVWWSGVVEWCGGVVWWVW